MSDIIKGPISENNMLVSTDDLSKELLQGHERLWNAILIINGIFLSFLAILSTTGKISLWLLLVAAFFTAIPMTGILYKFLSMLKTSSQKALLIYMRKTIQTDDQIHHYEIKLNEFKKNCLRQLRYQNIMNPILVYFTLGSILLEFLIISFVMLNKG